MLFNLDKIKHVLKLTVTVAAASLAMAVPAFGAVRAYSGGNNVNLRTEPNTSSQILGTVREREELSVTGKAGEFMQVTTDNGTAYISKDFVVVYNADGIVTGTNVNVRNLNGDVIGRVNKGDNITVTATAGDMYRILYNGAAAFVHSDYVDCEYRDYLGEVAGPVIAAEVTPIYAVVTSSGTLNLRAEPSTGARVTARLGRGEILDILENGGAWIQVKTKANAVGYVSAAFIEVREGKKPEQPAASSKGVELVSYAKQFLGTPYVYGGTNLSKGVDCSGFIYAVFRNFGITMNRTSAAMPANGTKINKSELIAGDLVFFSNGGAKNIQHVGIYCGDGTFIHSATGGARRVIISSMNEAYYVKNYITAARVLR